ncbi:MAG TPA: RNA 2',3'-cyclic phosphodiesterase [Bryobacteraceae bacterium]|nr:RNA 2',3'-cyclic phosphodiesterase [Bryobacteraceae bacterium]
MRLFTGIALPEHIQTNLTRLIQRLRPTAQLNWSPIYNLHLTTKFIGEWPPERLQELSSALAPVANRDPINIVVGGIGWFPEARSPRVLYVGIKVGPELQSLAQETEDALAALGVARESRKFSPHLTLARIKDPAVPLAPLRNSINQLEHVDFGTFTADAFHLYHSKPGPSGSIYSSLAEFPLVRQ